MGEVIKGHFGAPRPDNETLKVKEEPVETEATAPDTVRGFSQEKYATARKAGLLGDPRARGLELLGPALDKVQEIERFISGLAGFHSSKTILATAERFWMSLSVEELVDEIMKSTSVEWTKKPNEYIALVREHKNRVFRILDQFSK